MLACVHLVSDGGGYVKIGISSDIAWRLQHMQTSSPHPLRIELVGGPMERDDAARVERRSHAILEGHRRGGEWFAAIISDALAAIRQAQRELGILGPEDGPALIEPAPPLVTDGDRPELDCDGVETVVDMDAWMRE